MDLVIVSRWAGGPLSDWYPWLATELAPHFEAVHVPRMPRPERAEIGAWLAHLGALCDARPLASLGFVGHSVGCQAILRYLASRADEGPAGGFVAVGGWWRIPEPWPTLLPWLDHDYDLARAAERVARCEVLISDDDPYTPDWAENALTWRERLSARVQVLPGRGHFNRKQEPEVLEACLGLFARGLSPRAHDPGA